ncbi:hypothetical protein [Brumimicrobium aurantiacum]|uniref:Lipoprotein n=1 Tax=Brumimicrobium aurantiacum TaxID=1737063 RepID=A0A3E1EUW2_9FLAO|nr:hypothetical protein [Brumimicrobium aurantiacum]RFC53318.1 hypothetical protein DXU93_12860 [Brumimicrobium aurantiacum]
MYKHVSTILIITFIISSCGSLVNTPVNTIQEQTLGFHEAIEDSLKKKHSEEKYQSLAFGKMKVFKPDAFLSLDSLYTIKQKYLENDDLRGLNESGVEDLIPRYRAEALKEIDEVKYEIEHIYQLEKTDSITVHHDFFVFNYKDSISMISPFYQFNVLKKYKSLFYDYQFNQHFETTKNYYLSDEELEFLNFFKAREAELIGTDQLQPFMDHTFHLMSLVKKSGTVDFRNVSRKIVLEYYKELNKEVIIESIVNLLALERNDKVIGYELAINWRYDLENSKETTTTFEFSPYLELIKVKDLN